MTVWKSVDEKFLYGIAKNNFSQDKSHRLTLDVGDAVIILKETSNWYYGYNKKNRGNRGIFPKSYIQLMECVRSKSDYVIKRSEIVDEITTVLVEWGDLFKKFYLTNNANFLPIRQKMLELIRLRSQILSGNLPVDEMKEVKLQATAEIDVGNSLLGLDMVVRNESGSVIDINSTSTTQLYELHVNAVERIRMASTSFSKNRVSKNMNKHSHNLLVRVHAFVCKFQEDSDLLITLYDADEQKSITENYVVKWGRQGLARDIDQFDNNRVLFTDLSTQDLNRNKVYLICYAIRIGGMDIKEPDPKRVSVASVVLQGAMSKKNSQNSLNYAGADAMRRPFGVAAIDLTPIIKKPEDFKNNLDLPFILCEKENLDTTLKKLINNKDVGKIDSKLAVSVEVLHGDIKQIREDYPHLVHGNVPIARKMGFPEVIFPGDVRNDMYLSLVNGEFSKGVKSGDKNIEVMVCVCNEKGVVIPDVITLGAGYAVVSEYKSVIYYHEDKPKWNETFKVQVPIEEFKQCHLRFTFKHRSSNETKDRAEKPFALSYVKLMQNDGTTLQHMCHKLLVYKIDQKKYDKDSVLNYLSLPSKFSDLEPNTKPSAVGLSLASKDFFVIETNLCSTKLTQDVALLGLLNWSSNLDGLENSLNAIMGVKPEEVVKFLQDILDALFCILVQNNDPSKYDDLVFRCLLRLIEIVSEIKYQHFQSVLDLYINESFSATLAYDKLINVLQTHIKNAINSTPTVIQPEICTPIETEMEGLLYKITKNLQYIMKFIIRSRILFADLNDNKDRVFFEQSLDDLLTSFKNLIACPNNLLRSQGATLKYLHVITSDLMKVYSPIRLSQFIVDIILNIPPGRLTQSKMMCIKDMIDSKLFKLQECRSIILPVFCQQIKEKLESKEEGDVMSELWQQQKNLTKAAKVLGELKSNLHTRESTAKTKIAECVNIMNNILGLLHRKDIGSTVHDIRDIMFILLRTVIQSSIQMDRDNPLVGNLVAIMLGIFRSMKQEHYAWYVNHFGTKYDLMDFLTEILHVFKDLVSYPVFASDWMDMIMHQNIVILESLKHFTNIILEKFFVPFEKQVWSNFFHCSIAFLIQPSLQLDQFTTNKTSTILLRYRDIRKETAFEIRKMWFSLGENKIQFVPQLVGPLLEMSLIPEPELRQATIPIFFDMMQAEYCSSRYITESYGDTRRNNTHYKGNFNDFENEMIEKLDILIEGGRGDNDYREMFYHIMMENCRNHNTLKVDGTNFVVIATKLMERLLEYRCIIHDESKENRMACTVSLLQFYSEVNRKEMYIRYVNKLCDLHMEFDNYTEAAFTLKLHSNLLMWNDTGLSSLLRSQRFPHCQTHRQLKEALYHEIIKHFDNGKMWECALAMCKELAEQYENKVFDYISLSDIHQKMAAFYGKILKEMRHENEYFRVAFYGLKFPEFLRNKIFIYRGKEYERLSDFCTRILTQHPAAELMQTLTTPGQDVMQSDGQFIQVNSVEPIMAEENERYEDKIVAQQIVKYYQTNNVQKFKFSRPYRDGKSTSNDSVANMWLERTIMQTTYPLPGILRWFPVEATETFKISPIEHAIETMEATNKFIRNLVIAHRDDETLPINPLSMKINGIVDPAVMGGFRKYEEAFLTEEYLEQNPDDVHFVVKLKELIAQQIPILEIAVHVHRSKAPKSLAPFHERLEKCFFEMQAKVEIKYGKRTSDLKFDREFVTMRRGMSAQMSLDSNRLSETSMGSNDSGLSKSMQPNRSQTSSIKSTFANFNFNAANLTRTSLGTTANAKKSKEKSSNKRRSSRKIDRESLNVTTSQWYTGTLTPITSTPPEKDTTSICSNGSSALTTPTNSLVVELTEELTPKRPLRSEIERERRLSRTASIVTPTNSIRGLPGDSNSVSDAESNRNSIVTTDSTASDEDLIPPPLPAKTRDSTDYTNLPNEESNCGVPPRQNIRSSSSNKPLPQLPIVVNVNYEYVEARNFCIGNDERKRPPTPPPKPTRNSKGVSSP
ncbi:dedicator of cytokinesis protein 1 isoform X1 [Phlebotomus argentipes]|uniref:dedicator of cytokinesis protein 1 isoform X1 n=1 Tax=Phlebotomus argentipes TaxID=94469 RepID=UPI002892A2F0|nr:dedicator of cytokinesis protein 1 isoform X1 [Phlebotomus argentipes]